MKQEAPTSISRGSSQSIYISEKQKEVFSLSDCSIGEASDFIDYLLDFCFEWNIPLSENGIERTYDVTNYIKICAKHRICCVCGERADIHHDDAIGMGNNRNKVDDSRKRKMPLCRIHHTERHQIGSTAFNKKYHVYGVYFDDSCEDEYVSLSECFTLSFYCEQKKATDNR